MTLSPDRRLGVLVPEGALALRDEVDLHNHVVEVTSGKRLAVIEAQPGFLHLGHDDLLPCRWARDGSLLLWEVQGKWSPSALVLLRFEHDTLLWQRDLLSLAQQAILEQTRRAVPDRYQAAQARNAGNGAAYPDGFTVDVRVRHAHRRRLRLPLEVVASLTADPKRAGYLSEYEDLNAMLEATVESTGEFTVRAFRLGSKPFPPFESGSW